MLFFSALTLLAAAAPINAAPTPVFTGKLFALRANSESNAGGSGDFQKQNGIDAQKLNTEFQTLKQTDSCNTGDIACISGDLAQCANGKWETTPCSAGTTCVALPLVNSAGTSVACDTQDDALARFQAAGVQGGLTGNNGSADPSDGNDSNCGGSGDESTSASQTDASATPAAQGDRQVATTIVVTVTKTRTDTLSASAPTSLTTSAVNATTSQSFQSTSTPINLNSAKSSPTAGPAAAIKLNKRLNIFSSTGVAAPTSTLSTTTTGLADILSSDLFGASSGSSTPLPTPTNATPTTSASSFSSSSTPAVGSLGEAVTTTGVDGTVTVTVTATGQCGPSSSALSTSTSATDALTPSTGLPSSSTSSTSTFTPTSVFSASTGLPVVSTAPPPDANSGIASSSPVSSSSTTPISLGPSSASATTSPTISSSSSLSNSFAGPEFTATPSATITPSPNLVPTDSSALAFALTHSIS